MWRIHIMKTPRLVGIILLAIIMAGCSRIPLQRTLPEYVNSVYVPMIVNRSYEPGVEEILTNAVIDEFLADGRLRVERKTRADISLNVILSDYETLPSGFHDDEFPSTSRITTNATIIVINNIDGAIMGEFEDVTAIYSYQSDPRRVVEEIQPRVKEEVLKSLAFNIVQTVISGQYEEQQ